MKRPLVLLLFAFLVALSSCNSGYKFEYEKGIPQVEFAVSKLEQAFGNNPIGNQLKIKFSLVENGFEPQSFHILKNKKNDIEIQSGDASGLMYGGLELAERIELGMEIDKIDIKKSPFQKNRGIKLNFPLDARCPSYDDTGDAAQKNIVNMWDFEFWKAYFDKMAEFRYNVLSLWSPNPFQVMCKLPSYPNLALDDVCVTTAVPMGKVGEWSDAGGVNNTVLDNLKTIKNISIDEKIKFWQKVFDYAQGRGVDIYLFTWNIYTNGTYGQYGLTDEIENETTKAYYREAIRVFLETYPQVKGIGVTAGERMHVAKDKDVADEREKWLWETYGLGILDYKKANPEREIPFIHRVWYSKFSQIMKYWENYPDQFDVGYKYVKARIYSSPKESPYIGGLKASLIDENLKCWWNLRNDDIYVYRWGDPDYVRTFLSNLPKDITAGYHMGPDGYVFGRVFSDKSDDIKGKLEFEKHWYKFMLWGRLGYDNELDNAHFKAMLKQRYPGLESNKLFKAWQTASKIIPQVNRFMFHSGDRHWSPEMCASRESFKYTPYLRIVWPMPQNKIVNPQEYWKRMQNGNTDYFISPSEIVSNLKEWSRFALEAVTDLHPQNAEEKYIIADIKAMAHLGAYYACKIKASNLLERLTYADNNDEIKQQLFNTMGNATNEWRKYAEISDQHYHTQMYSRVNIMDWNALLKDVERDEQLVKTMFTSASLSSLLKKQDKTVKLKYESNKHFDIDVPESGLLKVSVFDTRNELVNYYTHPVQKGKQGMVWEDLTWLPKGHFTMIAEINDKTSVVKFNR